MSMRTTSEMLECGQRTGAVAELLAVVVARSMSSTHNESRLAACPLSGRSRSCQLIPAGVGTFEALFSKQSNKR